jgi:hypothetical protein
MTLSEVLEEFAKAKHPGANWIQELIEKVYLAGRIKGLDEAHSMLPMQIVWYPKGYHIDANEHGSIINSSRKKVYDYMLILKGKM